MINELIISTVILRFKLMLSLPKSDKKGTKQSIDPTVIDESLILKSVKDYNAENKIITADLLTL